MSSPRIPTDLDRVTERLEAFLRTRGIDYSAFLTWALNKAEDILSPCVDADGSGYCEQHLGWDRDFRDDEDYTMSCDMRETLDA